MNWAENARAWRAEFLRISGRDDIGDSALDAELEFARLLELPSVVLALETAEALIARAAESSSDAEWVEAAADWHAGFFVPLCGEPAERAAGETL